MAQTTQHAPPAQAEDTSGLTPRALSKQEFGRRLHDLMLGKGWNQSDLARAAQVGRDSVSKYIRGNSLPNPTALRKLSKALGVADAELLPNSLMQALQGEHPAIELRAAAGHPDQAWLRINRMVPFEVATRILALINEADQREAAQG